MTRSRDTDRNLERWMDDGPTVVADRVIAGAAEAAFSHFHDEMQVGWGLGASAGSLGFEEDEGSGYLNHLGNAPPITRTCGGRAA